MTRLSDIAGRYRLFFVDQFGVLHDGTKPYPGAVDALRRLHGEGRTVVVLSNSGKRSAGNEARMERLGFPKAWHLFLSSGEVAWRALAAQGEAERPKRCLVLARDGDTSPIDGLGIGVTDDASAADLVLIAGSEAPQRSLDDYRALLAPAAGRGVKAMCVNPDMTMILPEGGTAFGAGRIARLYEELGGPVTWIGKPYPEIYRAARAIVGLDGPAVGIGDSVEHDIAGAKGVGADGALVLSGIHADEADLEALYAREGARPDHVLERFAW